jgi:hypothetical protein
MILNIYGEERMRPYPLVLGAFVLLTACSSNYYLVKRLDNESVSTPYVFSPQHHHFDSSDKFKLKIDGEIKPYGSSACRTIEDSDAGIGLRSDPTGSLSIHIDQEALRRGYVELRRDLELIVSRPGIRQCISSASAPMLVEHVLDRIPKTYSGLLEHRYRLRRSERSVDIRPGDWLLIEYVVFSNGAVPCYVTTERIAYQFRNSGESLNINRFFERLDFGLAAQAGSVVPIASTADLSGYLRDKRYLRIIYPALLLGCDDEVDRLSPDSWPVLVASSELAALNTASGLLQKPRPGPDAPSPLEKFCANPPLDTICLVPIARSVEVAAEVSTPADPDRLVEIGQTLGDVLPVPGYGGEEVRLLRFHEGNRVRVEFDDKLETSEKLAMPLLNGDRITW